MAANACGRYANFAHVYIAAAGKALWKNKAACGRFYDVKCIGATNAAPYPCKNGNVRVEIIDYCHGCRDTLNLYEDAFFKIVDLEAGRIKIEYAVIAPQK